MPDDLSQSGEFDRPALESTPEAIPEPTPEPEPDGVVDVPGRGRMVDVSVVAGERKRVREREVAPLREQLRQHQEQLTTLQQHLQAAQPYLQLVQQHPELLRTEQPTTEEQQIPEEEAERYARRFDLYDPQTSTPDVKRARAIIADHRRETRQIAQEAAREAVTPLQHMSAEHASRANFVHMAQLRDADGRPLVDPRILATEWAALGPELTQYPQVAEVVLNAAIGKMHRTGGRVPPSDREPLLTEAPGGRAAMPLKLSTLDQKLGLTDKDLKAAASRFVPGGVSLIGED